MLEISPCVLPCLSTCFCGREMQLAAAGSTSRLLPKKFLFQSIGLMGSRRQSDTSAVREREEKSDNGFTSVSLKVPDSAFLPPSLFSLAFFSSFLPLQSGLSCSWRIKARKLCMKNYSPAFYAWGELQH